MIGLGKGTHQHISFGTHSLFQVGDSMITLMLFFSDGYCLAKSLFKLQISLPQHRLYLLIQAE